MNESVIESITEREETFEYNSYSVKLYAYPAFVKIQNDVNSIVRRTRIVSVDD